MIFGSNWWFLEILAGVIYFITIYFLENAFKFIFKQFSVNFGGFYAIGLFPNFFSFLSFVISPRNTKNFYLFLNSSCITVYDKLLLNVAFVLETVTNSTFKRVYSSLFRPKIGSFDGKKHQYSLERRQCFSSQKLKLFGELQTPSQLSKTVYSRDFWGPAGHRKLSPTSVVDETFCSRQNKGYFGKKEHPIAQTQEIMHSNSAPRHHRVSLLANQLLMLSMEASKSHNPGYRTPAGSLQRRIWNFLLGIYSNFYSTECKITVLSQKTILFWILSLISRSHRVVSEVKQLPMRPTGSKKEQKQWKFASKYSAKSRTWHAPQEISFKFQGEIKVLSQKTTFSLQFAIKISLFHSKKVIFLGNLAKKCQKMAKNGHFWSKWLKNFFLTQKFLQSKSKILIANCDQLIANCDQIEFCDEISCKRSKLASVNLGRSTALNRCKIATVNLWRPKSINRQQIATVNIWQIATINIWRIATVNIWRIATVNIWRIATVNFWLIATVNLWQDPDPPVASPDPPQAHAHRSWEWLVQESEHCSTLAFCGHPRKNNLGPKELHGPQKLCFWTPSTHLQESHKHSSQTKYSSWYIS